MISPLLLKYAARYGHKFVKMFANQAPKVKIPAPSPTKDFGKWWDAIGHAGPSSPKFRKEAAQLLKDYPNLFNSTSKEVNLASAKKLALALRDYKGPDMRNLRTSPQWGSSRGRGPNY